MFETDPQHCLLSIIIPCYNEEKLIMGVHSELTGVLKPIVENNELKDYEILFVDDGSNDHTLAELTELAGWDPRVKAISLSRRFGKEAALSAGLEYCTGDLALLLDADLQDPPALIPHLLNNYKALKCPVMYGIRTKRRGENRFMLLLAKIYYRLMYLLAEIPMPVDSADFKLLDKTAINAYHQFQEKNKYVRGLISWSGFKQVPFYYERQARRAGSSKFSLSARLKLASRSIFYFSVKPLKLIKWGGLLCCLTAGGLFFFMAGNFFNLILHLLFTGIQLTALGIVAEYISHIFTEIKGRPEYMIKGCLNLAIKERKKEAAALPGEFK